MSATDKSKFESADADYIPQPEAKPGQHRTLIAAIIGIAGLALLLSGWLAIAANAQDAEQRPAGDGDDEAHQECLVAALAAAGEAQAASNPPSDAENALATQDEAVPTEDEAVLTEDPFHDWCENGGAREFTVVQDENVDTISINNTEIEGDPAA